MGKYMKWILLGVGAYLVFKNWEKVSALLPFMTKNQEVSLPKEVEEIEQKNDFAEPEYKN